MANPTDGRNLAISTPLWPGYNANGPMDGMNDSLGNTTTGRKDMLEIKYLLV
jgi:hypothetical protein